MPTTKHVTTRYTPATGPLAGVRLRIEAQVHTDRRLAMKGRQGPVIETLDVYAGERTATWHQVTQMTDELERIVWRAARRDAEPAHA